MNPSPLIPPNFVTLKQLKEKREEEERLKKEEEERVRREEEERLRKVKEEEEDEKERARLRKLEDERNSIKVPSETLVSKSPYRLRGAQWRRSRQRSANPDARGDACANFKAREAVNPDARDDANFEGQVAANGTVEESRKKAAKKKARSKSKKKGASEEKEGEIAKVPLDVNRAPTIEKGEEKEKEKKLAKMNPDLPYAVYRPVRVLRPDKGPIEDVEKQVSDLKIGGKDPNRNHNWRRSDKGFRRGGRTWISSAGGGGGGGGGMMWVKKTMES